jgi:hypothetical protein
MSAAEYREMGDFLMSKGEENRAYLCYEEAARLQRAAAAAGLPIDVAASSALTPGASSAKKKKKSKKGSASRSSAAASSSRARLVDPSKPAVEPSGPAGSGGASVMGPALDASALKRSMESQESQSGAGGTGYAASSPTTSAAHDSRQARSGNAVRQREGGSRGAGGDGGQPPEEYTWSQLLSNESMSLGGLKPQETMSDRAESLRVMCEDSLGVDDFIKAYAVLSRMDVVDTAKNIRGKLVSSIGEINLRYVPLVHQLITCEEVLNIQQL